ncbi:MAG: hypothetical protein ACRD2O_08745 [Terriglobia bacterium]
MTTESDIITPTDTRTDTRTVTAKRRAANQAAAQKSTGPQTPEGKQRAAFNSFQHGAFAAQDHILQTALAQSGSDPAEFDARRDELAADWQPAGAQQRLLVDDLAWLYWLRDQSRLALVEGQARRLPRLQLERDQRRGVRATRQTYKKLRILGATPRYLFVWLDRQRRTAIG